MTQPSESEIAKAREIATAAGIYCRYDCKHVVKTSGMDHIADCPLSSINLDAAVEVLSRALHDAAKVKAGCVRTDDGVERQILNQREFDSGRVDYVVVRKKERPICQSCGAPNACDKESGQGVMCGISACKDCFMEWYDGDRPAAPNRESWEAVGNWVKSKREAAQRAKEQHEQD